MKDRLPSRRDIMQVFAVLMFVLAGWTFNRLAWQLSSWSNFLDVDTLVGIVAYRIATSFLESLVILAFLLFLCVLVPPKYLQKEKFIAKGTIFVLVLFASLALFWKLFYARTPGLVMAEYAYLWLACSVVISLLLAHFSARIRRLSDFLSWLSESMTVFLYVLIPIAAASLAVILVRNII